MWIQIYTLVHIILFYIPSSVLPFKKKFHNVFNRFENIVWIPNVIAFPVLLGLTGRHLNPSTFPALALASAAQIISSGSLVASAVISWCAFTPDYGVYHDAEAST